MHDRQDPGPADHDDVAVTGRQVLFVGRVPEVQTMVSPAVTVHAPATIGNFGPGFDACSLALSGLGDTIELEASDEDVIELEGPGADDLPTAWEANVVGPTIDALRRASDTRQRFRVRITKGQPPGSGLGSSASSAGGAALAFQAWRKGTEPPEALVEAAAAGEAVAAGRHYDDVAAVVLGGLAIVQRHEHGLHLARVQPPTDLHIAIVTPHLHLPTRDMRALLPETVLLTDAVHNIGSVALLVDAMHRGDTEAVGRALQDRLATPARSGRLPFLASTVDAARAAGAFGAALAGSGPSVVAVVNDAARAETVAAAMREAVEAKGLAAHAQTAVAETEVMHRVVAMH